MADLTITPQFQQFLDLCAELLEGECVQFLDLIKRRYAACSQQFRNSPEMETLLDTTTAKLRSDRKRLFVHLKDFVTELKAWAVDGKDSGKGSRKRKFQDPLQAVAKAARVEESTSDSSDMEGKLRRAIGNNSTLSRQSEADDKDRQPGGSSHSVSAHVSNSRSLLSTSSTVARGAASGSHKGSTDNSTGGCHSRSRSQGQSDLDPVARTAGDLKLATASRRTSSAADVPSTVNSSGDAKRDSPLEYSIHCEEAEEEPLLLPDLPRKGANSEKHRTRTSGIKSDLTASVSAVERDDSGSSSSVSSAVNGVVGAENQETVDSGSKSVALNNIVDKLKNRCVSSPIDPQPSTSWAVDEPIAHDDEDDIAGGGSDADHGGVDSDVCIMTQNEERVAPPPESKTIVGAKKKKTAAQERENSNVKTDKDSEKQLKHARYLERLLEKIRDKIEQVREKEVSLDELDAEDSSYIFEDRLQKKFVKVWNKLCQMKGRTTSSGRPVERRFKYEGTRYPEINRKIEHFVNKRNDFPDYHDIRGIVRKVNTRSKLGLGAQQLNDISREAFLDVGEALQKRRHEDFITTFHSKQTMAFRSDEDPALFDAELRRKLDANRALGKSKLEEVITRYTQLQYQTGENEREGRSDPSEEERSDSSDNNSDRRDAEQDGDDSTRLGTQRGAETQTIVDKTDDEEEEEGDDYGAEIEMDLDEGWQRQEGEPLSQEYLQGPSLLQDAVVHSSDRSSRELSSNDRSRAGSFDFDASDSCSDVLDIDLRSTGVSEDKGQRPAETGRGEETADGGVMSVSAAGGTRCLSGKKDDVDVKPSTSRGYQPSVTQQPSSLAHNLSSVTQRPSLVRRGVSPATPDLSTVVKNALSAAHVASSVTNNSSFPNASGVERSSRNSPVILISQNRSLKHPYKTKPNSKSPVRVSATLKLPSYLIRKAGSVNGDGASQRENLFYPGKTETVVKVKKDSAGCMVIDSSDEDEDKGDRKVVVKQEGQSSHSSTFPVDAFQVNGRRVKQEVSSSSTNGVDDDVIVLD